MLREGLARLGLSGAEEPLERYIQEIELFNPAYGLVKVRDRDELNVKHILDSLTPFAVLKSIGFGAAADAGSGAGLPGIPLAIAASSAGLETRFTLIERMGRRAAFLRNCTAVLGLSQVTVEEAEFEKAPPGRFTLGVFRALAAIDLPLVKKLSRLLAPGGVIAAYKGRRQIAAAEIASLGEGGKKAQIIDLEVPFLNEERCLVLIPKPDL